MNELRPVEDSERLIQLDRLASGDLSAATRRELFEWLDADSSRWRRCALVLLETRELEQVFQDWTAEVPQPASPTTRTVSSVTSQRHWGSRLAIAASVLVSFGLGVATPRSGPQFDLASVSPRHQVQTPPPSSTPQSDHKAKDSDTIVRAFESVSPDPQPQMAQAKTVETNRDPIPAYVRSQLERRGFRLDSQPSVVSVAFPNGRNVDLPVNQVQFSYVGQRSY